jgi:hypothetical protein
VIVEHAPIVDAAMPEFSISRMRARHFAMNSRIEPLEFLSLAFEEF